MRRILLIVAAVAAIAAGTAFGQDRGEPIRYVDGDAPPGGDGLTWQTAFAHLPDAIKAAAGTGEPVPEIRIAQGTYRPDETATAPDGSGQRESTFELISGVILKGGYLGLAAGKSEDPDTRDIEKYQTILSGDLDEDDEPGFINIEENSYNVVTASGAHDCVLDGVTITGGNADGPGDNPLNWRRGAGIWNQGGTPTLIDCTIVGNRADFNGGGMYNHSDGDATLIGCTVSKNVATDGSGGGVFNWQDCDLALLDCLIEGNDNGGSGGGGLSFVGSVFSATNCVIANNTTKGFGGGIYLSLSVASVMSCEIVNNAAQFAGGVESRSGNLLLEDCDISGNSAKVYGGGIILLEGGVRRIDRCRITDNTAQRMAGLIHGDDDETVITNSIIASNHATVSTGAACLSEGAVVINCLIADNTAGTKGGGLEIDPDEAPVLINCTLVGNTAAETGGALQSRHGSNAKLFNCVLWDNYPNEITLGDDAIATLHNTNIRGGWNGAGSGNLDADPLFVDPANGDYHLMPGSPCIDRGDAATLPAETLVDLDGVNRFIDESCIDDQGAGAVTYLDLGIYEHQVMFVDCDGNGIRDVCEIQAGLADDINSNGILDQCEEGLYIGPPDGDWSDPANWSGGNVPNQTTPVTIPTNLVIDNAHAFAASVTILAGATLDMRGAQLTAGIVDLRAGAGLTGDGVVHGDVLNRGEVNPGSPIGMLSITGNYVQSSLGRLVIDVDGVVPGLEYDQFSVAGAAALDGTLRLISFSPHKLMCFDEYDVLTYALVTGQFSIVEPVMTAGALGVSVDYFDALARVELFPTIGESQKLVPNLNLAGFGQSIDIKGDIAVIGCERSDDVGAAFVYRRIGEQWELAQMLDGGDYHDHFGEAVATNGDWVAVGVPEFSSRRGQIRFYRRIGDSWGLAQELTGSELGDRFGQYFAMDAEWLVAVVRRNALVYRLDGLNWVLEQTLTHPDNNVLYSAAIDGDSIVVGAPFDNPDGSHLGAGYVYRFDGAAWQFETKLVAADGVQYDRIGSTAALSGNTVVLGRSQADAAGDYSGLAYAFDFNGTEWVSTRLIPSDLIELDALGHSIDVDGDMIVVGAPGAWVHERPGSAYSYIRYDGAWVPGPKVTSSEAHGFDFFGSAVAVSAGQALIGASLATSPQNEDIWGAVFVFDNLANDCNGNGALDSCDIVSGASLDLNQDGVPDECEADPCPGDLNLDGVVNVLDLLDMLGAWGACSPCPQDLSGDGVVNVLDLLELLGNWGPCIN